MSLELSPCSTAIMQGWGYLVRHVLPAGYFDSCTPLFQSAAWRDATAAIDTAALAGDLPGTQAAYRALWAVARAYVDDTKKGAV